MGVDLSGTSPTDPTRPKGILESIEDGLKNLGGVAESFADGLNGIIGMIADALFPGQSAAKPPLVRLNDGMTALHDRVELLADVSGYAGAILTQNHRFGSGSTYKTIPFNKYYGPHKNAELSGSRIYLSEGTWSAHFTITTADGITNGIGHGVRALVRDETGAAVITRLFDWQTGGAPWDQHYAMPIVAPVSGWSIELGYRHSGGAGWRLLGGTERTLIWVERKDLDSDNHEVVTPTEGSDIN